MDDKSSDMSTGRWSLWYVDWKHWKHCHKNFFNIFLFWRILSGKTGYFANFATKLTILTNLRIIALFSAMWHLTIWEKTLIFFCSLWFSLARSLRLSFYLAPFGALAYTTQNLFEFRTVSHFRLFRLSTLQVQCTHFKCLWDGKSIFGNQILIQQIEIGKIHQSTKGGKCIMWAKFKANFQNTNR